MRDDFVQARVERRHRERIEELKRQTGLNQAEVLRRLIENSTVISLPMPAAEIGNRVASDSEAQPTAV